MTRALFYLTVWIQAGLVFGWAAPPRVAIVDLSHYKNLAPLLAAALDKVPEVDVVSREEVARLVLENEPAELVEDHNLAELGTRLHAEGLLILEKCARRWGDPATPQESVRLVSAKNGACLLDYPVPNPPDPPDVLDLTGWAEGFARQVKQRAPMLGVPLNAAVPIVLREVKAEPLAPGFLGAPLAVRRLLERALAQRENIVLLDRRRLVEPEPARRLEAGDLRPLADRAVTLDASVTGAETVQIKLTLTRPSGLAAANATASGAVKDLPAMAETLANGVLKSLGQPVPTSTLAAPPTAAEFFAEAVWAWSGNPFEPAFFEALSAARALGEKSGDAAALEAIVLVWRAQFGGQAWLPALSPAEQGLLFEGAFASLAEYQKLGGQFGAIKSRRSVNFREPALRKQTIYAASEMLRRNDEGPTPLEFTALRARIRAAARMEADSPWRDDPAFAAAWAPHWARDGTELLAFYEKLLRASVDLAVLLPSFPSTVEKGLGPRFQNEPATAQAWEAMWQRLLQDPATRLRALLIRSREVKSPEQEELYRTFLRELAAQAPALLASKQLGGFLMADGGQHHMIPHKFEPERTEVCVRLCETLPAFVAELIEWLSSVKAPAGAEQRLWVAYAGYRDRCLRLPHTDEREREPNAETFTRWQSRLLANNPGITIPSDPEGAPVRRLWTPYLLPGQEARTYFSHVTLVAGGAVWTMPAWGPGDLFEVSLPDLQTQRHHVPFNFPSSTLAVTPDALWLLSSVATAEGKPRKYLLAHRDRKTGEERLYTVPGAGRPYAVGGRVFFYADNWPTSLSELIEETGEFRPLVVEGRKPALSPLDEHVQWGLSGVIPGPGAEPFAVLAQNPGGMFQIGGSWKRFDAPQGQTLRWGDQSVIVGNDGEALHVDPTKAQPEWWLAGAKSREIAREKAKWACPPEYELANLGRAAFREGELFAMRRDAQGRHLLRWWRDGGPREGIELALRFDLPAADRAALEPEGKLFRDFEGMCNPDRSSHLEFLHAAQAGLVLANHYDGFWYIALTDLHAAAEAMQKGKPVKDKGATIE